MSHPCPVCRYTDGFHDADLTLAEGGLHAAARARIDPHLTRPPNSAAKADKPPPCTTIFCVTCKRATDDPAHKFGCDCPCNWAAHMPSAKVLA